MSHRIAGQHPAVVLRSHYVHLRALLAVMIVLAIALTAAIVVLATDDDGGSSTSAVTPISAPAQTAPGQRYDGGPEEGTRGSFGSQASPGVRYDGGPEEGTRGLGF